MLSAHYHPTGSSSEHGVVIRDGFPVSPGHTLIIPKRHLDSFFNLSAEEKVDLMALLDTAKDQVEKEFKPPSKTHPHPLSVPQPD